MRITHGAKANAAMNGGSVGMNWPHCAGRWQIGSNVIHHGASFSASSGQIFHQSSGRRSRRTCTLDRFPLNKALNHDRII